MDKLTEFYARSAYSGQAPVDIVGEFRSMVATAVLLVGVCANVAAPIALGWWLLDVVGFH